MLNSLKATTLRCKYDLMDIVKIGDSISCIFYAHADISSGARGLNFCLRLDLFHTLLLGAGKAQVSWGIYTGLPQSSLFNNVICTKISCR